MPEMGVFLLAAQAMAAPGELLNLSLNATAVLPEGAVLLAMIATLLVDLAGEKVAARWVPPICYAGLGTALLMLALQWNSPVESSFLGRSWRTTSPWPFERSLPSPPFCPC